MTPEQLAPFGLHAVEAQIYLYLVGKPPKSIVEIARELGIPRTSVYDNGLKLAEKGLVQKILKHKSQQLQAYPVSILQTYIDKEKARVEELQNQLATLEAAALEQAPSPLATEVRYYHGAKGLQQMMWNVLGARGEIVGYAQFGLATTVSQRFADKWAAELIVRQIPNRVITNPHYAESWRSATGPIAVYRRTLQECRVMDAEAIHVAGDTTIYNNVFAAAYWEGGEVVGVEIENVQVARTQRSLFDVAWPHGRIVQP